jgi:dTDP-glucose 4,6-dehydratase
MRILITGGAGFIGSAVCRHLIGDTEHSVVNVDKLTYCSNLASLAEIEGSPRYSFVQADICDGRRMLAVMEEHAVDAVLHLAAESHVDRSIDGPSPFIETNIVGTYRLLEAARRYWEKLDDGRRTAFRFHQVSTDEVFGDLPLDGGVFVEETPYRPSSPYSASKASADLLVLAWHHTYGLPVIVSNTSNNYGPRQFPEKLIPLMILNGVEGKPLPVYGKGENVRDWIHVDDHARALVMILTRGRAGEKYNVGARSERSNLAVVRALCDALDRHRPHARRSSHHELITFVKDRPGHDRRYAIDSSKVEAEFGWRPAHDFERGLADTVHWYLENEAWWRPLRQERYTGERIGVAVTR